MKKKIQIGPFKFKVSYKNSRWLSFFKKPLNNVNNIYNNSEINNQRLLEIKLYRIFKEDYCEFFHAHNYGLHGTEPSSYIYYNGDLENQPQKYLIGEIMFGENKEDFFKRKNVLIHETIKEYTIKQDDLLLATYNKEWVETQNTYRATGLTHKEWLLKNSL